ncbi:MAG: hypothetical protein PQJ28_00165, partial [Spirochaetales bacterium]|nr:hypothetical protein [Spirochaetales bacterium]
IAGPGQATGAAVAATAVGPVFPHRGLRQGSGVRLGPGADQNAWPSLGKRERTVGRASSGANACPR